MEEKLKPQEVFKSAKSPFLLLLFFSHSPSTTSPIFQYYHHHSAQAPASHADILASQLNHRTKSHHPLLAPPLDSRPDTMSYENHEPGPDTYSPDKAEQGHMDEYPCPICSGHFLTNNRRATHMRTRHDEARTWLCRECPKGFADRREYTTHLKEHVGQGRKTECDVCNYVNQPDVIRRHKAFDHAADGSHLSHCGECEYQNDSCCGVSFHTLHMHPGRTVPLLKPTGLATPPVTPPTPRQPPTESDSPAPGDKINPEHKGYLHDQEALYESMSQEEKDRFHMPSRERKRLEKAAAAKYGRPAPGSSS